MKIKTKLVQTIDLHNWNRFIIETYNRHYDFQQQNGCMNPGVEYFSIPSYCETEDDYPTEIPFEVNGYDMGVNFETWSTVDVEEINSKFESKHDAELFWERNYYPSFYVLLNDLYKKGLIEEGDYQININW